MGRLLGLLSDVKEDLNAGRAIEATAIDRNISVETVQNIASALKKDTIMEYRIYEDSYNRFSPVMQDLFRNMVSQAVEIVNSMNRDVDVFDELYTPRTILDQAIELLKMEMDPTNDGMFRVTDLMENAMKFTIMEYLKYEVSEDERYRDELDLDLDRCLDASDR